MNNVATTDMKSLAAVVAETPCVYLLGDDLASKATGQCTVSKVDIRTVDDPSKLRFDSATWYDKGTNHRLIEGEIARDLEPTIRNYAIIPDLKAFMIECDKDDLTTMCTVVRFGELTICEIAYMPDWQNW